MDVRISHSPAYAMATVVLAYGEEVLVERSSMTAMSPGVSVVGTVGSGGVGGAVKRKLFGGQAAFWGRYRSEIEGAWVKAGPRFPGDLLDVKMTGGPGLLCEAGAAVLVCGNVDVDVAWGGLRNVVMQTGLTLLRLEGVGDAVIGSYGGIEPHWLEEGQHIVVDTGHLVGWDASVTLSVRALGSVATSAVTGEWVVGVAEGPGRVYLQTRAERDIKSWLFPSGWQNER